MNAITREINELVRCIWYPHPRGPGGVAAERVRYLRWLPWIALAVFVACLLLPDIVSAETASFQGKKRTFELFDVIEGRAKDSGKRYYGILADAVRNTFTLLGILELGWAGAIWLFEKDNLSSFAVEVIKKFMLIGFGLVMLNNGGEWVPMIADSFSGAGMQVMDTITNDSTAAGKDPDAVPRVSTDYIIALGLAVVDFIWNDPPKFSGSNWDIIPKYILAALVSLGVIICFVIVAAQWFMVKIESALLFAAGAVFLGLGASSWTKDYVHKFLTYGVNVGVRLLILILILAFMLGEIGEVGKNFTFDPGPMLEILAMAILMCLLGIKSPEMANTLMSGTGAAATAGGAGQLMKATWEKAGDAVGAAKAAGGMAKTGAGGLARGGAAGGAGIAKVAGGVASATLGGLGKLASKFSSGGSGGSSSASSMGSSGQASGHSLSRASGSPASASAGANGKAKKAERGEQGTRGTRGETGTAGAKGADGARGGDGREGSGGESRSAMANNASGTQLKPGAGDSNSSLKRGSTAAGTSTPPPSSESPKDS